MPVLEEGPKISDQLDGGETHDCGCDHNLREQDPKKYERYRLDTFQTWPQGHHLTKDDLARNGFSYIGDGNTDKVQCAFCKIILKEWGRDDNIEEEHKKFAPLCPFVRDSSHAGNFPLGYRPLESTNIHHRGPRHREYENLELRFKSFNSWPKGKTPTPSELANAGFFYLGLRDFIQCYYCGGKLQNWKETDDVWTEHRKWFPLCLFVAEHDPATHSEMQRHLYRTISEIAIANGFTRSNVDDYKHYTQENGIPIPEAYGEYVNQLDQFLQGEQTAATGTSQDVNQSVETSKTKDEEQITSDRYLCKVCYQNPVAMIFYPCKHVCCCTECSDKLSECPVCRSRINGRLRIFFS